MLANVMQSVQLEGLYLRGHFCVVDNLVMLLAVEILFIGKFVQGIFPMKRLIFPIKALPHVVIPEHSLLSNPLDVWLTHLDIKKTEECVSFHDHQSQTHVHGIVLSSLRNWKVLLDSETLDSLT